MFLKLGSTGSQVEALQQLLLEVGLDVGIDGHDRIFGRDTLAAVLKFQAEHFGPDGRALKPDGVVGDKTWWALQNPQAAPPPSPSIPDQTVNGRIAAVALQAAMSELMQEVRESPPGSNRGPRIDLYTALQGEPPDRKGPAWCAYFVSWCFAQAPGGSPFGRIGGALNLGHWGRRHNCNIDRGSLPPLAGDIFVIDRDGIHGHTGLVRAVEDGGIWTVEGNSANAVRSIRRPAETIDSYVRIRP